MLSLCRFNKNNDYRIETQTLDNLMIGKSMYGQRNKVESIKKKKLYEEQKVEKMKNQKRREKMLSVES